MTNYRDQLVEAWLSCPDKMDLFIRCYGHEQAFKGMVESMVESMSETQVSEALLEGKLC